MKVSLSGYARVTAGTARGIALEPCCGTIEAILAKESLYEYAARQPGVRKFTGRAPVYSIELPGCGSAMVRRSMRGGPLAPLATDLFLPPTRGLRELVTSLRLRSAGVATPEVMAFAVYRAGAVFRQSDVITREIPGGYHLAEALLGEADRQGRAPLWRAAAQLVADLSRAGAHHPDLNLRNILVTAGRDEQSPPRAHILDVDRIGFHIPGDPLVLRANIARLARSLRKWREQHGLAVDEDEVSEFMARIAELSGGPSAPASDSTAAYNEPKPTAVVKRPAYPMDRICIVLMSAVGDAIHALPVINAIKRHHPTTHVTWVLQPGPAKLFRGHPSVDDMVMFNRNHGWRAYGETRRELKRRRFDLLLDLQIYLKAGIVTALSGAPLRLGFNTARARDLNWLFTNRQIAPHKIQHVQDQFFEFLGELGISPEPVEWNLGPWDDEREWQQEWIAKVGRTYAAIVVASSKPAKDWIPERWAQVCDILESEYNLLPVLVGGETTREAEIAARISAAAQRPPMIALGTGLRRLLSILDASSVVLSPDTGPLHMAVAIGRPVISLIGYSDPRRTGPYRKFHDLIVDAFHDNGETGPVSMDTRTDRMERIKVADVADRLRVWSERYRAKV